MLTIKYMGGVVVLATLVFTTFALTTHAGKNVSSSNQLGCTPYLSTTTVGETVTVYQSGRNIPNSQSNQITWAVPVGGSPSTGVGKTFSTTFTETGFLVIHMYYKGEFTGVCAFEVQ
jgi:hypothetical protein